MTLFVIEWNLPENEKMSLGDLKSLVSEVNNKVNLSMELIKIYASQQQVSSVYKADKKAMHEEFELQSDLPIKNIHEVFEAIDSMKVTFK